MNDHQCEVRKRDLDDVRYDLNREIETLKAENRHLKGQITSLKDDLQSVWSAINELSPPK